jgi:hypothetical protein
MFSIFFKKNYNATNSLGDKTAQIDNKKDLDFLFKIYLSRKSINIKKINFIVSNIILA